MDVARLTEMNTMLKEEMRRQERSTEREKQMQNLEYIKNVIFKVILYFNPSFYGVQLPVEAFHLYYEHLNSNDNIFFSVFSRIVFNHKQRG